MFCHIPDGLTDYSGIIATGSDSSSRIAIGHSGGLSLTLNHGHLTDDRNLIHFDDALRLMSRLTSPRVIVSDSHPGLASSRIARTLAGSHGIAHIEVDHAHAHAAAVMAEHGLHGRFIAIVLDGGDVSELDNPRIIRGSELLLCSRRESRVLSRGQYIAIPRNATAAEAAVGLILAVAGSLRYVPAGLTHAIGPDAIVAAARRIQDPHDSILVAEGRALWDGVAALIATAAGLPQGARAQASDLERLACGMMAAPYPSDSDNDLSLEAVIDAMLDDLESHTDPAVVAARFHASRAFAWAIAASRAAAANGIKRVIITGDMTQNHLLLALLRQRLNRLGLEAIAHHAIAPTDSATALGQAAIAAALSA